MPAERVQNRNRVIPFPAPAMSSIPRVQEHPTELHLDYGDVIGGQLVIVIHGVPTADREALTPRIGPRINRSSSSPLIEEIEAIGEATGYAPALAPSLLLAAWRGREVLALELIAATIEEAPTEDVGRATALTDYAKAVLYNGLGRYQDALVAAQRACNQKQLDLISWARLELVEAAARSDAGAVDTDAMRQHEHRARAGSDWALGAWARSAALLSDGTAAEGLYREAIERFDRGRIAVHLPRAQLVYGEWLRRENRRVEARKQLRAAH
jgi:tetratricopeptide (TPR) repeat protein